MITGTTIARVVWPGVCPVWFLFQLPFLTAEYWFAVSLVTMLIVTPPAAAWTLDTFYIE